MLKGVYKITLMWQRECGQWVHHTIRVAADTIEESIAIARKKYKPDVEIAGSQLESVIDLK